MADKSHLGDRTKYIGASDAKRILDGDWFNLWAEKTGRKEPEDLDDVFKVQLGIQTEDFHLDWTIRRMVEAGEVSYEVKKARQHATRPPEVAYVLAHVDTLVARGISEPPELVPVEAKHSSGKRLIEDLTSWYMPQVQHQIWCMGKTCQRAVLSIIQGNEEPERIWIGRSDEWIAVYADACARFWHHVETNTAPAMPSPGVEITPKVADAIPINGLTRRCVDGDNAFLATAADMIKNEAAAQAFEKAKADLKKMILPTESELYSKVLTLKRDKRGAVRMTIHERPEAAA